LAGAESYTIAPSKYLGHYVVGNLAHRHGIAVRLEHTPTRGVTATVDVPGHLLVQVPMPLPTPAGGLPGTPGAPEPPPIPPGPPGPPGPIYSPG
jgi:hypothetical protein